MKGQGGKTAKNGQNMEVKLTIEVKGVQKRSNEGGQTDQRGHDCVLKVYSSVA